MFDQGIDIQTLTMLLPLCSCPEGLFAAPVLLPQN